MSTAKTCRQCVAFAPNPSDDDEGLCRKYPPQTHMMVVDGDDGEPAMASFSAFPQVKADEDWCCEFLPVRSLISLQEGGAADASQ